MNAEPPCSDPSKIYRYRDGICAVDLLVAAICHLDLFTLLSREALTLEEICARLGLDRRAADVMLTLLVAMGFLRREGEAVRATLEAREFLVADSPWNVIPYYASSKDRPLCRSMLEVLRTGKPARWGAEDDEWAVKMGDEEFARSFTAEMNCRGGYLGPRLARQLDLSRHEHLLDIGGGSGIYAMSIVEAHPHVRATVFEKSPVDRIAAREIARRGFDERVTTLSGDMFVPPLPGGADVHLFSNVLHDWAEERVLSLLRSSHEALAEDGLLVIHDAFLDREKTGPLHVAEYSALLMHFTEGKCYSLGEIASMLETSGFSDVRYRDVAVARGAVTARRVERVYE